MIRSIRALNHGILKFIIRPGFFGFRYELYRRVLRWLHPLFLDPNELTIDLSRGAIRPFAEFYYYAPPYLKSFLEAAFWPLEFWSWFRWPLVYFDWDRKSRFLAKPGYYTSHQLLYDRRIVFIVQLSAVILSVLATCIVNGFLTLPGG